MNERRHGDLHARHLMLAVVKVVKIQRGGHLPQANWEVAVDHLPFERSRHVPFTFGIAIDADVVAWDQRRDKEGEALDVIPMRMSQEEMRPHWQPLLADQVHAQEAQAGPGVEDNQSRLAVRTTFDFRRLKRDARRVAAVAHGVRTGSRNGAAHSPEANAQRVRHLWEYAQVALRRLLTGTGVPRDPEA